MQCQYNPRNRRKRYMVRKDLVAFEQAGYSNRV